MSRLEDLSIEDLEELISESSEEVEQKEPDPAVMRYIKAKGLDHGKAPVMNAIIYYDYYNKFEPTSTKKLSYIQFFREFNKVFDQRRTGKTRYYMLQPGIYSLDKESIDVARQFREKISKKQS